ncbi:hypothetical protein H072_542 [Dactylellina haptotyla CBS 200.50]|uniref:Uncharacterized protein n=1 Tax=Dactylellina haptotyla (strain CBS 200.50) TaxID=1284197 RepID=S8AWZ4_DACHA|nr:hypothetical protein H072_542 [Dactylellina haptotyla CBS 200.50]
MASPTFNDELQTAGGYHWLLTNEERQHIAEILEIDESNLAHVSHTPINRSRMTCTQCGKRSGLDDVVQSAHELGVHTSAFMINVLVNGLKANGPVHGMDCSRCGERFDGVFSYSFCD